MASFDRGITPGILSRNFATSETLENKARGAKATPAQYLHRSRVVDYKLAVDAREGAVAALSAMQAARPLKPPGRR